MKLHLPVRLFKSVLTCLSAVASFSLGSGVAWAEVQNLIFNGTTLTWDTSEDNKPFVDEEDAAAAFAAGDNVSFTGESAVTLGENITAGTLDIAAGADVTIDLEEYTLHTDTISLSGTLDVGDSLSIASGSTLAVKNAAAVLDSALVLGEKSGLVVESAASLNNNTLTLHGGSNLILTAAGDGKTYTLFSGISSLVDKNGNTLTAGSYSINDYFDKDAPGSGFWADATLVYTADGSLQIVRHNETVKAPLEITESKTGPQYYNYYKSISFLDCSIDNGVDGDNIELNNNGSVTFSGNTASSVRAIFVSAGGTIMLSNNGSVEFSGYTASSGGAILGEGTDSTELSNNGSVTFKENMAFSTSSYALGGAICGTFSTIELSNNGRVEFCGNKTSSSSYYAYGGAIYGDRDIDMAHNGSVWFSGNEASSSSSPSCGGAIYSVAGGCSLTYNDIVSFRGNKASSTFSTACGGAIYGANRTSVTLRYNGNVEFIGNSASTDASKALGGAIDGETITLSDNGRVAFEGNTASSSTDSAFGGAIDGLLYITLSDNGSVVFEGNTASSSTSDAYGGAIYGGTKDSTITLNNNGSVEFIGNDVICGDIQLYENIDVPTHGCGGGAIHGNTIELSNNGSVSFYENSAIGDASSSSSGGAIDGITITLSNNDNVSFIGNSATSGYASSGGAIFGTIITLSNNGNVTFSENSAHSGGAIAGVGGSIKLSNNSSVTFSGNSTVSGASFAPPSGSAIYGNSSTIELSKNDSVTFSENSGSVIYATGYSTIILSNNGSVAFSENSGRVIYSDGHTPITLSNNGSVTFRGNSGGVICGNGLIELNNNDKVVFSGNSGSAIYGYSTGCSIMLRDNGSVTFRGNFGNNVSSGAIFSAGHNFSIRNNDSVLFEKNAAVMNGVYKLRSIYTWLRFDELSLSAAAGKSIEFRDSAYLDSASSVELNADYTDAAGVVHKQMGDIIFTGKYTEQHLNELLATDEAGRTANAEEILASRTTVVKPTANLYNGRLIIKEGAIWSGAGITVGPVAGATGKPTLLLQNGTLTHDASSVTNRNVVTIKSGGAFEVAGKSQADYTSLNMESGSILTFNIAPENASTAALTLDSNSSLTQEGALTLKLKGDNRLVKGQSYKLLTGLAQPDTWDETSVTVESGSLGWDVDYTDLTWEGDTLWIYYNGNILPPVEFRPNLDRNQQAVYDTIKDIMGESNPGGVLGELGKNILDSRDESALKRALDELSGREYATIMSSQMEGNLGHLRRLRSAAGKGTPLGEFVTMPAATSLSNKGVDKSGKGATVMMAPSPVVDSRRIRAGIAVFHEQGELDADRNGDGFERSETGAQLTMEYLVSNEFIMGMGISQSRTRLTPDYGKRQDEDNTHFDLYGVYQSGSWSSTTSLGVGLHQHELGRTVAGMQTEAEADGFSVNFLQELAYTAWADEEQGVQVFAAVESSFNKVDGFTEKGAGNASLQIENQDAWVTDVTLGLRYNRALPALSKAAPGTLSLQGGVVASLGDVEQSATMSFTGAPGYRFKQHGAERERWGYSVGASVNLPVTAETALYGSAEAVIRNASTSVDAQLGVKMAF